MRNSWGATVLATAFAAWLPLQARAQDTLTVRPAFDAESWLAADARVELLLSRAPRPADGRLSVWLGGLDVSAMLEADGERIIYQPRVSPLPAGEAEIVVYLVAPTQEWRELGRFPIRVLTRAGLEQAELVPRLSLNNKGQIAEGHEPDTNRPPRAEFQDFSANIGFQTAHGGGGWLFRTQSNFLASSNRQEALRFSERQDSAPRFDLSDYLVTFERGPASLSLGHVSYGTHRYLLSDVQARGILAGIRLGSFARMSLAGLSGNTLVGWSNLLGISRSNHRILSGNLTMELVPRLPGALQLDASLLDGSTLPQAGFSQGAVNDAEKSRGGALRLAAHDPTQRVRLEAGYARTRFANPADPLLAQNESLVPVRPATRAAKYVDFGITVLRDVQLLRSMPLNATVNFRHENVAPLYRTVAMPNIKADLLQNTLELTGGIGALSFQVGHARAHDNLDEIQTILSTHTRTTSANLSIPFAQLLGPTAAQWLPLLTLGLSRNHQFGEGPPLGSENVPSFVPDQVSENRTVSLQAQGHVWRLMLQLNRSTQDNRQTLREAADFTNTTATVALGVAPMSALDLNIDVAQEQARSEERAQKNTTRRGALSIGWRPASSTGLMAALSTTRSADRPRTTEQDATDLRVEVSQRVALFRPGGGREPAQLFVRYARQLGAHMPPGELRLSRRNWTLNTGMTLGLL